MPINITLPQFRDGLSTKDHLVSILADEWPLSTKEIHSKLSREKSTEVSYQAVHKVLKQLENEGVVELSGKKYALSEQWVKNVKTFAENLEERRKQPSGVKSIGPDFEGSAKFVFDDYSDFSVSMAKIFKEMVNPKKDEKPLTGMLRHLWWPLTINFRDFFTLCEMVKAMKGGTAISYCDTPLDRWVREQYLRTGFTTVKVGYSGGKCPDEDVGIYEDYIIRVRYSPETRAILDDIYANNSNLTSLYKEYVKLRKSEQKLHIEVTIEKDRPLADMLRKHMGAVLGEA